jgi:hypothetical protein
MASELLKQSFNGSPPQSLMDQLHTAALRIPLHREPLLWSVFRHLLPDAGSQLVRSWLLAYDPTDVARMERAATHLMATHKGKHAAALDLMRWTEAKGLQVVHAEPVRWHNLYFRVLQDTAEERAKSMKRGGAFTASGVDMATPELQAGDCPMRLSSYKFYRSQLLGLEFPLRNITSSEELILREYCGERASLTQAQRMEIADLHARLVPPLSSRTDDSPGRSREETTQRQSQAAFEEQWLKREEAPNVAAGEALLGSRPPEGSEEETDERSEEGWSVHHDDDDVDCSGGETRGRQPQAAFEGGKERLKQEGAECPAEQELLESLETEDSKSESDAKKKAKKAKKAKKKRRDAADEVLKEAPAAAAQTADAAAVHSAAAAAPPLVHAH